MNHLEMTIENFTNALLSIKCISSNDCTKKKSKEYGQDHEIINKIWMKSKLNSIKFIHNYFIVV